MELTMDFPQRESTISPTHDIQLFCGRAHKQLAEEIASYLGTSVGPMIIKNFADGEIYVQVQQSIRGDDVFIIQPLSNPVNENLMELLIMIDAFKAMHTLVFVNQIFILGVAFAGFDKSDCIMLASVFACMTSCTQLKFSDLAFKLKLNLIDFCLTSNRSRQYCYLQLIRSTSALKFHNRLLGFEIQNIDFSQTFFAHCKI